MLPARQQGLTSAAPDCPKDERLARLYWMASQTFRRSGRRTECLEAISAILLASPPSSRQFRLAMKLAENLNDEQCRHDQK